MRTSNFSSARVTIVIIDSESMSRSSVKDLSSWTASVGRPVSSFTISASPARMSSLLAMGAPFLRWLVLLVVDGRLSGVPSGEDDDLACVGQSGAEPDLQGDGAARGEPLPQQPFGREWDGCGRGVPRLGDVTSDDDRVGKFEEFDQLIGDAHVRLVRDEHLDVVEGQARRL